MSNIAWEVMVLVLTIVLLLLIPVIVYGVIEQRRHQNNVDSIPIRINVNGIRGKSTVTRLITAVLHEAGYKTIGKTTGTSARMIYPYKRREEPIERRPEGPNIGEQRMVVKRAAKREADALVCECMAVTPDYQIVFQEKLIQANIGVIVNVLEDHLDVMGPTLDEVAEAFTATIPYNGYLVTIGGPYLDYFKKVAKERNTKVIVADDSKIPKDFLRQFDYIVFPDNASLTLAVADVLEIPKEIAFRGMLHATPDPGALRIKSFGAVHSPSYFANGFAANDPTSTLRIWEQVQEAGYPTDSAIVIMNCRLDRIDRSEQFARDAIPYIQSKMLVLIGEGTQPIMSIYKENNLYNGEIWDMEGMSAEQILDRLEPEFIGQTIYGIGNIKGVATDLIEQINKYPLLEKTS